MEPGGARQWIACKASGEVLVVDPRPEGPLTRWDMGSGVLGVQRLIGGVLIDREGADSRAGIYEDQGLGLAELQLGPHATGMVSVSEFGEAFSVGRGPAGHVELRGRAPAVEYQYPLDLDTKEGALDGALVGPSVGAAVGSKDGNSVGFPDGCSVGAAVGCSDGNGVGNGLIVGTEVAVGSGDGSSDGGCVG